MTANASQGDNFRFMVIYDTQTNSGAAPTITDILATADVTSPMNLNNRDRFHVIWDSKKSQWAYTQTTNVLTNGSVKNDYMHKYKKCKKEVVFSGTGGTIGSIQTGSILFLTCSQLTTSFSIDGYFRFRFYDS